MITRRLAEFAAAYPIAEIPAAVSARALALFGDLAGSMLRAAAHSESRAAVLQMVEVLGLSGGEACTVLGLQKRYGAAAAALLNGTFAHSLDFDDTHADSSLHPSAPVIPAALAAAELTNASGAEFLAAVVIGYEICCRIGLALDPTAHYARGFHPTATAGTFGAAAAAGRLLGLTPQQMVSAFGVAASQASGSLQFLQNGAWNKRYQTGEAAMKGLIAATLAQKDFLGAEEALEGKHGFLRGYSDGANAQLAVAALGECWETLRIGVKPYPACRYTHAALDGLLALIKAQDLQPSDIEAVSVGLHQNGIALVGAPIEAKRQAQSVVEGQFSMPFAAAVALLRRGFGWDDYALLGDQQVLALSQRVDVFRDESLEGLAHPFGATLNVTARGQSYTLRIPDPSGEPETFPDAAQLGAKFTALAAPLLPNPQKWLECFGQIPLANALKDHLVRLQALQFGPA